MLTSSQPARPSPVRTANLLSLVVLVALGLTARAADEPPGGEEVVRDNTEQVLQQAGALAGAGGLGGPGTTVVLGMLLRGDQLHLWKLEESDTAPELRPALLKYVKDSTEIRIDDSARETEAYCEAVMKARFTSVGAFANSSLHGVTFTDLFTDPGQYRGRVIHYEGQIRAIRRIDAPLMLSGKGIKDLYECWLFGADDGMSHPVCLVCTELPEGVKPGEKLALKASFDAYFFKRYRYEAVGSKVGMAREAPLFIGRSFVLPVEAGATAAANDQGLKTLLLSFLGIVVATFVLAIGLHFWFRRSDRRLQEKLKAVRAREQADPGLPGLPDTTPSAN
jgi:hypothetical protein